MTQEIFDRVVRDGRRRRARFLGGAAVVVAGLVTAGVVLLPGDGATDRLVAADGSRPTASPTDCPATAELARPDSPDPAAVPEQPQGFDSAKRLLPDEVPSSVVVCRYDVVRTTAGNAKPSVATLRAGRSLSGDLAHFAAALDVPVPGSFDVCRLALPLVAEPVRVAVTYASGARAWLVTETDTNGCAPIGNGKSISKTYLTPELIKAWESGRWGPAPSPTPTTVVAPVSAADCPTEATKLPEGPGSGDGFPVPAPPTGFDAASRLLPDEVPSAVLVCRYEPIGFMGAGVASLRGGKLLGGDLSSLAGVLDVPVPGGFGGCTLIGSPSQPILMHARYASGASAWLATETDANACIGIGNGKTSSRTYVAQQLVDAWDRDRWDPPQPAYPCGVPDANRPGQSEVLVPEGFETVSVCRGEGFVPVKQADEVVRLLDQARTAAPLGTSLRDPRTGRYGGSGCSYGGPSGVQTDSRTVKIAYPRGRSVRVWIHDVGCTPSWQNGLLGAQPTAEQQQQLLSLLAR